MPLPRELREDEITGTAIAESEPGKAALADYAAAKEALARSDAAELFTLYNKALCDRNKLTDAFETIIEHLMGRQDKPRHVESDSSVNAIRDIALAAIEFAKGKS